jgi:hypothetical protein
MTNHHNLFRKLCESIMDLASSVYTDNPHEDPDTSSIIKSWLEREDVLQALELQADEEKDKLFNVVPRDLFIEALEKYVKEK